MWSSPWWGWSPSWYPYPAGYYDYGPPYAPPPGDSNDQDDSEYGDYSAYYSYGPPYAPPDSDDDASAPAQNFQDQQVYDPGPPTGNVAASMPTVLLYLTDGTVYPATQYWLSGDTVHYVLAYGGQSAVPIADVDMRKTINENAKRGVRFNLRPRDGYSGGPPPTASSPAPAAPTPRNI